jgi:hypothetical protein
MFIPSPLSIFFNNSSLFTELLVHIDQGEKLNIFDPFKGKKTFKVKSGRFFDFSSTILFIGSIIALYFGFDLLRRREFIKSLASMHGKVKTFLSLITSRLIILWAAFAFNILYSIAMLKFFNIDLSPKETELLGYFTIITLMCVTFFFLLGSVAGIAQKRTHRFVVILIWVSSVYIFPAFINYNTERQSQDITSNFQLELEKLIFLMDSEDRINADKEFIKVALKARNKIKFDEKDEEIIRQTVDSYRQQEFSKIMEYDKEMVKKMKPLAKNYQFWSSFSPSTFFLSVNNEISSRGFYNLIAFYQAAQKSKKDFVSFYTKMRAFELIERFKGKRPPKVVDFIDNKTYFNTFQGTAVLPHGFELGLVMTLIWILIILDYTYSVYSNTLFVSQDKSDWELGKMEIILNNGELNVVISRKKDVSDYLYNAFSGNNQDFPGKILWNDNDIVGKKKNHHFVYFCFPDEIPWSIRTLDFVKFICRCFNLPAKEKKLIIDNFKSTEYYKKTFGELEIVDRTRMVLSLAPIMIKESTVFMFDDFAKGLPDEFLDEFIDRLDELKNREVAILYWTSDNKTGRKICKNDGFIYVVER